MSFSPSPNFIWILQSSRCSKVRVAQNCGRRGAHFSENKGAKSECRKFSRKFKRCLFRVLKVTRVWFRPNGSIYLWRLLERDLINVLHITGRKHLSVRWERNGLGLTHWFYFRSMQLLIVHFEDGTFQVLPCLVSLRAKEVHMYNVTLFQLRILVISIVIKFPSFAYLTILNITPFVSHTVKFRK